MGKGTYFIQTLIFTVNFFRALLIDDVITAGTAIRESMSLLKSSKCSISGVVVAIDRMEKGANDAGLSAIQEIKHEYNIPVVSIINLDDIVTYLKQEKGLSHDLTKVTEYRNKYGAKY